MPLFELIGAGKDVDSLVFPSKEDETREGVTDEDTLEKYRTEAKTFVQNLLQDEFKEYFMEHLVTKMRSKIGLSNSSDSAKQSDMDDVIIPLLDWMSTYHIDYHRFYRSLSNYKVTSEGEDSDAEKAISEWLNISAEEDSQAEASKDALKPWLAIYRHRLLKDNSDNADRKQRMDAVNPRFVLRNSIVDQVIKAFEKETEEEAKDVLNACLDACVNPFEDHYEDKRVEDWINGPIPVSIICISHILIYWF
jgi:uncharacterized protein YdiU (UPF0061 family)